LENYVIDINWGQGKSTALVSAKTLMTFRFPPPPRLLVPC